MGYQKSIVGLDSFSNQRFIYMHLTLFGYAEFLKLIGVFAFMSYDV